MSSFDNATLGFWILGDCKGERQPVNYEDAYTAYSQCDTRAEVEREAYLSAFEFPGEFGEYLAAKRTTKGYLGRCGARWLWSDIDAAGDLKLATTQARRLCAGLVDRYGIDGDSLLVFFSGAKGYHVGFPLAACDSPIPSDKFHKISRRFAEGIAERLAVKIDAGVYDKVRAFRAPNSRHPKTGLHKRRLSYDELMGLSVDAILRLAATPEPFSPPTDSGSSPTAIADWREAAEAVERDAVALVERRILNPSAKLNRLTLEFIREGATQGVRHRKLFSAAANLAEFGCPPALAHELLTEPALDSGLSPSDVRRQIQCGLLHGVETPTGGSV
jgi:hypothetical protein